MAKLTMNGKTIDPKAIDRTEDYIIGGNIEDTMDQLVDGMEDLSLAYDGLCELLTEAGMDTKGAIFTVTDEKRGVLTLSGLDALKCTKTTTFTDTKPKVNNFKTKAEWVNRLSENGRHEWAEAVDETTNPSYRDSEMMSVSEVMDVIVSYEGGLATGYEIRCMINILYGGMGISEHGVQW